MPSIFHVFIAAVCNPSQIWLKAISTSGAIKPHLGSSNEKVVFFAKNAEDPGWRTSLKEMTGCQNIGVELKEGNVKDSRNMGHPTDATTVVSIGLTLFNLDGNGEKKGTDTHTGYDCLDA
jgi:hypothetical protein